MLSKICKSLFWISLGLLAGAGCVSAPAPVVGAAMVPVVRQPGPPPAPVFNPRDFGAKGDGASDDTAAVRQAIAACAGTGGSVLLDRGTFVTGNLELKSRMTFYIAEGATLKASSRPEDFPVILPERPEGTSRLGRSLLYAGRVEDLHLDGLGTIDGNGAALLKAGMKDSEFNRPSILRLFFAKNASVRNLTVKDSLMWTEIFDHCENLVVENQILRCPPIYRNHDGLDFCDCRQVVVRGNDLATEDDVICLKSHDPAGETRDFLIENNTIFCHGANGIKFGTATKGKMSGIRIVNNTIRHVKYGGLCIEAVDGGQVSDLTVQGLTMRECAQPIFIRLGNRSGVGSIDNIRIENVHVSSPGSTTIPSCTITGIVRKRLGRILLKDLHIEMPGGIAKIPAAPPERDAAYPQSDLFGHTPASVFFVRHADQVRFENVETSIAKPDARPWLYSDDAQVETVNCRQITPPVQEEGK